MHDPGGRWAGVKAAIERERSDSRLARWLFLRMLGGIYLIAFVSLGNQVDGLVGHNGILPAADFLAAATGRVGPARYWWFPTLSWLNPGDGLLHLQCAAGAVLSLLLMIGVAPVVDLVLLWALYLSLSTVCRDFLGFQWDILLLETGFLAVFLAPRNGWPRYSRETAPSATVLWLCRWLLFRLMFMSGAVKLLSGDAAWWNLAALNYHYQTQPLPTWIAWYVHQLPAWVHQGSVAVMFLIELAVPFLIFCGRRPRRVAFGAFLLLMLLISLTGNYCFFNLLTVALGVLLLDDPFLRRWLPRAVTRRLTEPASDKSFEAGTPPPEPCRGSIARPGPVGGQGAVLRAAGSGRWGAFWPLARAVGVGVLAALVGLVSITETAARLFRPRHLPRPLAGLLEGVSPLRTINSYGLFAVMTTSRPEIVIEGSDDGATWRAYEFKWKPGDLKRRPAFVAPHQPRLDWQMWFAALGNYRENPWFVNFLVRLLQGTPEVPALLEKNPFPDKPPKRIRAVLYEYSFTDPATRRATGEWWRRERKGLYCPEIALRQN